MKAGLIALLMATSVGASWGAEYTVVSTNYGAVALPFTTGFTKSLDPLASTSDYFVADYGFQTTAVGDLTSAVMTFNLANILGLGNLTLTLLSGAPTGTVGTQVSNADVAARPSRTVATASTANTISVSSLQSGNYTLEVRGQVTGGAGGSYAGVLNIASVPGSMVSPVPEPATAVMGLAGVVFAGWALRRKQRASRQDELAFGAAMA